MSSNALVQTRSSSLPALQNNANSSPASALTPGSTNQQLLGRTTQSSNTTPSQSQQTPQPSTPGQWEHPRMKEILQRQKRTTFDQTNATSFLRSATILVAVTFGPGMLSEQFLPRSVAKAVPAQLTWLSYLIQLFLLLSMVAAVMPLLRKKDAMEDIPLTPRQRQLLDLPPMSRSATSQEQAAWVTPPRYSRNTTPNSMDSLLVNARGTPLSGRQSPLTGLVSSEARRSSNSAFLTASGSRRTSDMSLRRESYGTPRSSPQAFNELEGFGQATKSSRASVGLNSKWLYDKGKDSPTSAAFLGNGWGTGSVFN